MNSDKLLAFVHTPKTAGTTVNTQLETLGPGISHIEAFRNKKKEFEAQINNVKWVSGHLPYNEMKEMLSFCSREVIYYASVREPTSQVKSHFNWLIEIFYKGDDFYKNHPENIKQISEEIRMSNRSDVNDVIRLLSKYSGLFLNFQSKFVKGNDGLEAKTSDVISRYAYICDESDVHIMLSKMGVDFRGEKKSNVSKYHFDPKLFETTKMKNFLKEANWEDYDLYKNIVQSKSVVKGFERESASKYKIFSFLRR